MRVLRRAVEGVVVSALVLGGACSTEKASTSGGLMIVVDTDMGVPKDIDRIDIQVTRRGETLFHEQADVGPGKRPLPAGFEFRGDRDSGEPVKIQAVGRKDGRARIVREAVTTVPADRVAELELPLHWLCDDTAREAEPGQVTSTCPDAQTCVDGVCTSSTVAAADLPSYQPSASAPSDDSSCFDALTCFGAGVTELALDTTDCSVPTPPGAVATNLNLAMKQGPGTAGVCDAATCWVVLDADGASGWNPTGAALGARITLPTGVCAARAQGKAFAIAASTTCATKTARRALCPAWTPPPSPSGGDVGHTCSGPASQPCGSCGAQSRACVNGTWSEWGACIAAGAGQAVYTNISAGQRHGCWNDDTPSAVIDTAGGKLLVVTRDSSLKKPALVRCNLDGTACTYVDISAGQGNYSGEEPAAAIDAANGKLLVVTRNGANANKPALFRCNLDGSACTYTDLSAGQGEGSGVAPSVAIDAANGKLLVVTANHANEIKPALFRCNLDGSGCTYSDLSAGQGTYSGLGPSVAIDAANSKLLVVTENAANEAKPALFRCNLDGSACTYSDISAGQGIGSGTTPSVAIDAASGKLLVVTENLASLGGPALFRCDLDGGACSYSDISVGQGKQSGFNPSAVIDAASGKLLVVTSNMASSSIPALFRCNLDGTGCTYADLSAGQGDSAGASAVFDAASRTLLVAIYDCLSNHQLALLRTCLP